MTDKSPPTKEEGNDPRQQGRSIGLKVAEPWPEPVDGAAMLDEVVAAIRSYLVMDDGNAEAVALWVVHAHAYDAFAISPRLAITSPQKGCGKTTMLDVVAALVPKPLPTANITTASVFRIIEKLHPTLLIDEADTFLGRNEELRGILNSGHRKSSAVTHRLTGDHHEPKAFSTWCPIAIAAIGSIPDTLTDRSIQIRLRRKLSTETVRSFRAGKTPELDVLARKAARWALDHARLLNEADPEMPDGIINRQADNWTPLMAIADAAGAAWPERSRQTALAMLGAAQDGEQPAGILLLDDIRGIFHRRGMDRIASALLVGDLVGLEDRPWATWSHGAALTPNRLARQLRYFGIGPSNMKTNIPKEVLKGYQRQQFEDAWARYLPPMKKTE